MTTVIVTASVVLLIVILVTVLLALIQRAKPSDKSRNEVNHLENRSTVPTTNHYTALPDVRYCSITNCRRSVPDVIDKTSVETCGVEMHAFNHNTHGEDSAQ